RPVTAGPVTTTSQSATSIRHGRQIDCGLVALNTGEDAGVSSVSCTSTGCVAGGWYLAGARESGFLVTQHNWSWQKAAQVPGLSALKTGGTAQVNSVSCTQAGWCA